MENELMGELAKVPKGVRYINAPNFPKIYKLLKEGTPYIPLRPQRPLRLGLEPLRPLEPLEPLEPMAEQTVTIASAGEFQIHPESYSPRVFCFEKGEKGESDPSGRTCNPVCYELLRTGESIPWPSVPSGFDFWLVDVPSVSAINMKRTRAPMTPEEKDAQRKSWVRGEMALGTDADEWNYRTREIYTPVPQADGDPVLPLDHLPEGSH
jgi:hypothetical protein